MRIMHILKILDERLNIHALVSTMSSPFNATLRVSKTHQIGILRRRKQMGIRALCATLVTAWSSFQVELHGQYSLQRLRTVHQYMQRTSAFRVLLVMVLTPLPCLVAVAISDSIPLEPPEKGIGRSHGFWVRAMFTVFIYSYAAIDQIRYYVPRLRISEKERIALAVPVAFFTNALAYGLARVIGFPLPFSLNLSAVPWSSLFALSLWVLRGKYLRRHPAVLQALLRYALVCMCQVSMVVVYPVFYSAFARFSSSTQTAFAMLLPVIKLVVKNLISRILSDHHDVKPEIVIFNVEVFHALFVSLCMQSSTSISTSIALIGVDFVQACISLHDLNTMLVDVDRLAAKMHMKKGQLIDTAVSVLRDYPDVALHQRLRHLVQESGAINGAASGGQIAPLAEMGKGSKLVPPYKPASTAIGSSERVEGKPDTESNRVSTAKPLERQDQQQETRHPTDATAKPALDGASNGTDTNYNKRAKSIAAVLTADERLVFVQKALQVLFLTEFLLLIEFTEVVIPVVYCKSRPPSDRPTC